MQVQIPIIKPSEEDVITLHAINNLIDNHMVFIDYFRYTLNVYGENIDISKTKLSYEINNDIELYKRKILGITEHKNMIPVVSIKPGCEFPHSNLKQFINKLQSLTQHVALILTEERLDECKDVLEKLRNLKPLVPGTIKYSSGMRRPDNIKYRMMPSSVVSIVLLLKHLE